MKTFLLAFLMTSLCSARALSECAYFRVSTTLLHCAKVDTETLKRDNPYDPSPDGLELDEPSRRAIFQAECSCDYSLMGSDPRCDVDQTVEKSSLVGAESQDNVCRRAATICRDVCPPRFP